MGDAPVREDLPPDWNTPPARFIEADEPVYALVGAIIRTIGADDGDPFQILVAPGKTRDFDGLFLPMFQFFCSSRTESAAKEWLTWAGAPDDALGDLVSAGHVARIDTVDPQTSAASFDRICLIPQSMPEPDFTALQGQIAVKRDQQSPASFAVTVELAETLWGINGSLDIPGAIRSLIASTGLPADLVARRVLTHIPRMLQLGLARLEWLDGPAA